MKDLKVASNLALAQGPIDKDGTDSESTTDQIIIDIVDNGFIVSVHEGEDFKQKVYLFEGPAGSNSKSMISDLIQSLGLSGKIKVEK